MNRRFGPVKGAGVAVVERESQETIEAAETGVVAVIGQFERGMISTGGSPKLNYCGSRALFDRKMGGRVSFSTCPDVGQDFFQHGRGAGEVIAVRLTDGTEDVAFVNLFARRRGADFSAIGARRIEGPVVKEAILKVKAKNAGRWAGRRRAVFATVDLDTLGTTTFFALPHGRAFRENEYAGAGVRLPGIERFFEIASNTADGHFVVKSPANLAESYSPEYDESYPTPELVSDALIVLDSAIDKAGNRRGLAVKVKDADVDPTINFGLEIYLDGSLVKAFGTLSMDPASPYYVVPLVNKDSGNDYVEVEDLLSGSGGVIDYAAIDSRPANFYAKIVEVTATTAKFVAWEVVENTDPTNIRVVTAAPELDNFDGVPPAALPIVSFPGAVQYRAVWNATTHKYAVSATPVRRPCEEFESFGSEVATDEWDVGAGEKINVRAVGGPANIILDHYDEPEDGATIVVRIMGSDRSSVGGSFAPDATKPYNRFRVRYGTGDRVGIESGDLLAGGRAEASVADSITGTKDGPFVIVAGVNDRVNLSFGGSGATSFPLTAGTLTATQIAGEINAAYRVTSGFPTGVFAGTTEDGKKLVLLPGNIGKGAFSSINVLPNDSHSAYETLGIVEGVSTGVNGISAGFAELIGNVPGPFEIVTGVNDKLLIMIDDRKTVDVTLSAGAAVSASEIADEVNAAFQAVYPVDASAPGLSPASRYPNVDGGEFFGLLSRAFDGGGPASSIRLLADVNGAYETLGLPVPTVGNTTEIRGTDGNFGLLSYADELAGGHDGGAVADSAFLDALSIDRSPLNRLAGKNKGLVQIMTPGILSTDVQKAGFDYAEARSYYYNGTLPETIVDEQSAIDFVNETLGRADFGGVYLPSFADVRDPDGAGALKRIPVCGMITGRDALFAKNAGGYHVPAAGVDATLPRIVALPTTGADGDDYPLNEEILTPQGINVIKKKGASYVVWGDRTISRSSAWKFKPHRLQISHYERTFLEVFDWVVFKLNSPSLRASLLSAFNSFFVAEYAKGALDNLVKFEKACSVKIDAENNPAAEVAEGNLNAEITLALANVVERFVISVGKAGLFEGTSN